MAHPPIETGVDDVVAQPRHTGHHRLDLVMAICAISISVISLFVAIEHGHIEEKLVAASSWPFIFAEMDTNGLDEGTRSFTLQIINGGVGPARIKSARILLDGVPMHDRLQLLKTCCDYPGGTEADQIAQGLRNQNPPVGVLVARDRTEVLTFQQTPTTLKRWARLIAIRPRLTFFACYCSVLDACWTTDLTPTADPAKVDRCSKDKDDYTE